MRGINPFPPVRFVFPSVYLFFYRPVVAVIIGHAQSSSHLIRFCFSSIFSRSLKCRETLLLVCIPLLPSSCSAVSSLFSLPLSLCILLISRNSLFVSPCLSTAKRISGTVSSSHSFVALPHFYMLLLTTSTKRISGIVFSSTHSYVRALPNLQRQEDPRHHRHWRWLLRPVLLPECQER